MAWIESHQELRDHPKTKRLARVLGVSIAQAVGHLHMLWWWALDYADDGDLSKYEADDVADGAGWEGDSQTFIEAAVKVGFLDRDGDLLFIHDWYQYAGRFVDKKEANRDRQRRFRSQRDTPDGNALVTRDSDVTNADVIVSNGATKQNLTIPNQIDNESPENKSNGKALNSFFLPDEEPYKLAVQLHNWIKGYDPKAKIPTPSEKGPFQAWCRHFDTLIRRDGRDPPEISAVIDWCQKHHFWHQHILSANAVCEKFTQLYMGMTEERTGKPINSHARQRGKVVEDAPITFEYRAGDQRD